MRALRDEVLAALRDAELGVAATAPGTEEHHRAADIADRLQQLSNDIETAIRLGITDRGELASIFEELLRERGTVEAR